jgi:hypothetical protein
MKLKIRNKFQFRALGFAAIAAVDLILVFIDNDITIKCLCLTFLIMAEINDAFNTYITYYKDK